MLALGNVSQILCKIAASVLLTGTIFFTERELNVIMQQSVKVSMKLFITIDDLILRSSNRLNDN